MVKHELEELRKRGEKLTKVRALVVEKLRSNAVVDSAHRFVEIDGVTEYQEQAERIRVYTRVQEIDKLGQLESYTVVIGDLDGAAVTYQLSDSITGCLKVTSWENQDIGDPSPLDLQSLNDLELALSKFKP